MTPPTLVTIAQVAEELNVTTITVNRWIRDGKLKAKKIGKSWRIEINDLKAFMSAPLDTIVTTIVQEFGKDDDETREAIEMLNSLKDLLTWLTEFSLKTDKEALSVREQLKLLSEAETKLFRCKQSAYLLISKYFEMVKGMESALREVDEQRQKLLISSDFSIEENSGKMEYKAPKRKKGGENKHA